MHSDSTDDKLEISHIIFLSQLIFYNPDPKSAVFDPV